jgi:hypothetical protein
MNGGRQPEPLVELAPSADLEKESGVTREGGCEEKIVGSASFPVQLGTALSRARMKGWLLDTRRFKVTDNMSCSLILFHSISDFV